MSDGPIRHLFRNLSRAAAGRADAPSDRELLRAFADHGDQAAFAALVDRHARLVTGTCRRWLRPGPDAEDAFQAVFLLLARKAGVVPWGESVAGWLHRAAVLVCRRAARAEATRRKHERRAAVPEAAPPAADWGALQQAVDEELLRLPDRYRGAVLLCGLDELSHAEAAARLRMSESTLRGRLHRGRQLLRARLARRGIQLGLGLVVGPLAAPVAPAAVAAATRAGVAFAAGEPLARLVSPSVAVLVQGGLTSMTLVKLKAVCAAVLVLTSLAAVGAAGRTAADGPAKPADTPTAKAADPAKPTPTSRRFRGPEESGLVGELVKLDATANRLTITPNGQRVQLGFDLAKTVSVSICDEPARADELKPGTEVVLTLSPDSRTVLAVQAWDEDEDGVIKAVGAGSVTVTMDGTDRVLPVRPNAVVTVDGFLCQPADLEPGMRVNLHLTRDRKTVTRLYATWAEDGDLRGKVKSVNTATGEILVCDYPGADEDAPPLRCRAAADTRLFVNGPAGRLADLKPGMVFAARMGDADKAITIRAWADE